MYRNEQGTADRACFCGTWADHWRKFNPKGPFFGLYVNECSVQGCKGSFEVGGHVKHVIAFGIGDQSSYILPMCRQCNGNPDLIFICKVGIDSAPANVSETCGQGRR